MSEPFHKNVPFWMLNFLKNKSCAKCQQQICKDDIVAIGIRQQDKLSTPYLEYCCSKCSARSILSFGGQRIAAVSELCYELIDQYRKRKQLSLAKEHLSLKNQNKPAITKKEADEFIKKINSLKTHDDFMKHIGAQSFIDPLKKNEN